MTTGSVSDSGWERVAAELRASRDAQRATWGDLDNTTLGRYLAGEVSPEELERVEQALRELPELRTLTDLVRDVLGESDRSAAAPEEIAEPSLLAFRAPARRPARFRLQRRYGALLAAAGLLLVCGLSLPNRFLQVNNEQRATPGVAMLTDLAAPDANLARLESLDAQAASLENQNRIEDAVALAEQAPAVAQQGGLLKHPRYAASLEHLGRLYEKKGDLDQAEPSLAEAHDIYKSAFGPADPHTLRLLDAHADCIELALNTPTPADDDAAKITAKAAKGGPRLMAAPAFAPNVQSVAMAPAPAEHIWRDARKMTIEKDGTANAEPRQYRRFRAAPAPVLIEALRHASAPARRQSYARALGQLGPAAGEEAAPALEEAFRRAATDDEKQTVVIALTRLGPAGRAALNELGVRFASSPAVGAAAGSASKMLVGD
jgi:hypothetical protein